MSFCWLQYTQDFQANLLFFSRVLVGMVTTRFFFFFSSLDAVLADLSTDSEVLELCSCKLVFQRRIGVF